MIYGLPHETWVGISGTIVPQLSHFGLAWHALHGPLLGAPIAVLGLPLKLVRTLAETPWSTHGTNVHPLQISHTSTYPRPPRHTQIPGVPSGSRHTPHHLSLRLFSTPIAHPM